MKEERGCLYDKTDLMEYVDKRFTELKKTGNSPLDSAMTQTYKITRIKRMYENIPDEIFVEYLHAEKEFASLYRNPKSQANFHNYRMLVLSWRKLIRERKFLVGLYLFHRKYGGGTV